MALAVGVGTVVGAGALNKTFGQLFHTLPETNYKDMLFDINQTQSNNGVTVTLTQGMCDGNVLYIIEKTEFDPSVITLTDEMFETSENGNTAPCWDYQTVINVKKTSEIHDNDVGAVIENQISFSKLLEHDEHSVTYLKTYGGDSAVSTDSDFFKDGTQFTIRCSNIRNIPGADETSGYECKIEFTFDVKLCAPVVYTLPEQVYVYNESSNAVKNTLADMAINPWFMQFAAGTGTGKILDTDLKYEGSTIEITMNNGTVYNEDNGILVGGNHDREKDWFGEDYDKTEFIYCTFDTEVDITNIKSIKLYGYELQKGIVPMSENVRKADLNSGKMNLPATSTVQFPEEEIECEFNNNYCDTGSYKYKINSLTIYDNLNDAGVKASELNKNLEFIRPQYVHSFNEKGIRSTRAIKQSELVDKKTGELVDNAYIFEFEIELTNIDANCSFDGSMFNFDKTSYFQGDSFFSLGTYDKYDSHATPEYQHISIAYLKESNQNETNYSCTFKMEPGKTTTVHVGFMAIDNNVGGFEQMFIHIGSKRSSEASASNPRYVFFNASKAIDEFEKNK